MKTKPISSAVGINDSERRNFVIIAAFNFHYNAKRYTGYILQKEMHAGYAFNKQGQPRGKKLKTVSSHQLFGINDPKNGNHAIRIVSRMFGYRPAERIIDHTTSQ